MASNFENDIPYIAENISKKLGNTLRVDTATLVGRPSFKGDVADGPRAFLIDGRSRQHDCAVILSNAEFPDFVDNAVRKAGEAKAVLGETLGQAVCMPILADRWNGQFYAVYQRLTRYSTNKYARRAQVLSSDKKIYRWLCDVFEATKNESMDEESRVQNFITPLNSLSADESLTDFIRRSASSLEQKLSDGELRAINCLQHGDFWFGNILFLRAAVSVFAPFQREFRVIDWAGCQPNGYPGMDALRFSLSAFGAGNAAAKRLHAFCGATGLGREEFSLSCLCALGWLGSNLDQFPKNRFNDLASNTADFLIRHGFLDLR